MGSFIELNDTLQLTREQGFPSELDVEVHLKHPMLLGDVAGKVYEFTNKLGIRVFHRPPVRVFLVENRDGKWIYWGRVLIQSITHDYVGSTTSGTYEITSLNCPDEMKAAFKLIDGRSEMDYFSDK